MEKKEYRDGGWKKEEGEWRSKVKKKVRKKGRKEKGEKKKEEERKGRKIRCTKLERALNPHPFLAFVFPFTRVEPLFNFREECS